MENKQEEKKARRSFWKGFAIGTIGIGLVIVEAVRGGKDIKQAVSLVKGKFESKPKSTENQNRQNNNGSWNNKRK